MIFQPSDGQGNRAEVYKASDSHNRILSAEHDTDPTLDRAVAALREQAIGEGPSEQVMTRTLEVLRRESVPQAVAPAVIPFKLPFWLLRRAAAIFLVCAGVALAVLLLNFNSSSVAFADVMKKVRESRSLTFTARASVSQLESAVKFWAVDDGRLRIEMGEPGSPEHSIAIYDPRAGKGIILASSQKLAVVFSSFEDLAKRQKGSDDFVKMIHALRRLGDKPEKELGEREFEGRRLRGFVATQDRIAFTVWADPQGGEPVRIEYQPLAGSDSMKVAFTDIRLDSPIDPASFDLKVPAGYWQFELPPVPGGEASLVIVLRGYAKRTGGAFPRRLTDWQEYGKAMKADAIRAAVAGAVSPQPAAWLSEDMLEYMANIGGVVQFLSELPKDTYGYLGEGKTQQDKDAMIFWFRRADGTHRAIFGDLSVRDVKVAEIPR
jgi:outer membrane lipoprotein-sorting protein